MNFQYTLASPLCKVFPNGQNLSPLKEPHLTGLRGETVSFQIAYLWNEWGREYGQVEVVPPCQGQVRVRTVELVPSQYPCHQRRDPYYLAAEPGLYPDLLRDLGPQGFKLLRNEFLSQGGRCNPLHVFRTFVFQHKIHRAGRCASPGKSSRQSAAFL